MNLPRDRRLTVVVLATAAPPLAFVLAGHSAAPFVLALGAIAVVTAALVRLEAALRARGQGAVSLPAAVLLLYGTGLVWYETVEPGGPAIGFLAGTLLVTAWWRRPASGRAGAIGAGAGTGLLIAAGTIALERITGGPTATVAPPALLDMLFSSRHGVLFWTPLVTLAALALLWDAARGRHEAAGALVALSVIAALDSFLRPWWSGEAGNARLLPALPLLAPGLASLLALVHAIARERPLRLLAAAGVVLAAWNLLLMAEYRRELVPRDDTVAFATLVESGAAVVSASVGSPSAWPANWAFAWRSDLPAARYDLLGGQDALAGGPSRFALGDPDASAAMLGEGWSVRHACGRAVCREIEGGRARLFLPLADARPAGVLVRAAGAGTLTIRLDGAAVAESALADTMTETGARLPPEAMHRGVNELVLELSAGGRGLVEAVILIPGSGPR